jgi:hypothetical protein
MMWSNEGGKMVQTARLFTLAIDLPWKPKLKPKQCAASDVVEERTPFEQRCQSLLW